MKVLAENAKSGDRRYDDQFKIGTTKMTCCLLHSWRWNDKARWYSILETAGIHLDISCIATQEFPGRCHHMVLCLFQILMTLGRINPKNNTL